MTIAAWLLAVALVALLRHEHDLDAVGALACSPVRLLHGRVWTLPGSALVIDGPPVGQLVMASLCAAWLAVRAGARAFWAVAAAGHLGATLLTYLGIGLAWLLVGADVDDITAQLDYGISAVWAATLGALAVLGWRLGGRRRAVAGLIGATALATFVASVPLGGQEADLEHLLAFLIGIGVALALGLRPRAVRLRS